MYRNTIKTTTNGKDIKIYESEFENVEIALFDYSDSITRIEEMITNDIKVLDLKMNKDISEEYNYFFIILKSNITNNIIDIKLEFKKVEEC